MNMTSLGNSLSSLFTSVSLYMFMGMRMIGNLYCGDVSMPSLGVVHFTAWSQTSACESLCCEHLYT